MSRTKRAKISIIFKFAIFIMAFAGIIGCLINKSGFMGGASVLFKYFTNQSNIWIALLEFVLAICLISSLKKEKYELNRLAYVLQLVFTVSITLTGLIFCFVLFPAIIFTAGDGVASILSSWQQILLHVFVPIFSIIDLLVFTRPMKFNYKPFDFLYAAIPPIYYLIFQIIGYNLNWDFGGGVNYPYFFMNWASPAGLFGFSDQMPYFMGNGYWIIVIVIIVLGFSLLYSRTVNKLIIKNREKLI